MARLEVLSSGAARIYEILEESLTIGHEAGNDLRLNEHEVAARHVRLTRTGEGYRVERLGDSASLIVNGRATDAQVLRHGDRLEIGSAVVLFLDENPKPPPPTLAQIADDAARDLGAEVRAKPTPRPPPAPRAPAASPPARPARPPAARAEPASPPPRPPRVERPRPGPAPERGHARQAPRERMDLGVRTGVSPWVWVISLAVVGGAVLLVQSLWTPSLEHTAADFYTLAESKLGEDTLSAKQEAIDYLELALKSNPSPELAAKITLTRSRLASQVERGTDQSKLDDADHMVAGLVKREAEAANEPRKRALARLLVRSADKWLAQYEALCKKYDDHHEAIATVKAIRDRHASVAQLDQPDDVDDLLLEVDTMMKPPRPGYRQAMQRLDTYLKTPRTVTITQTVERRIAEILREAKSTVYARLLEADKHIAEGFWADAKAKLEEARLALPLHSLELQQEIEKRQKKIDAATKK